MLKGDWKIKQEAARFPKEITKEYEKTFRDAGVELMNGKRASSYRKEEDKMVVTLDDGTEIEGDAMVSGLGAAPRLSLAEESGLKYLTVV